jgi:hypothetical protein
VTTMRHKRGGGGGKDGVIKKYATFNNLNLHAALFQPSRAHQTATHATAYLSHGREWNYICACTVKPQHVLKVKNAFEKPAYYVRVHDSLPCFCNDDINNWTINTESVALSGFFPRG